MKIVFKTAIALALAASFPVQATWSIAAKNQETGTIAVAGASCSYMVYGIASVIPGKGVVIVQAASNETARADATALLEAGTALDQIMAKLTDSASGYSEAEQQYALLGTSAKTQPLTYTGDEVEGFKGAMSAKNFTVQANTMVSDDVVNNAFAALGEGSWQDDKAMAQSLMTAMQAGAAAGGDKRCEGTGSASAFIGLYRADDNPRQPWVNLVVYGIEPGSFSALDRLEFEFNRWMSTGAANPSAQMFLIPAKMESKP